MMFNNKSKCHDGDKYAVPLYREETPEIESVSTGTGLPKFPPEQFPEPFVRRGRHGAVGETGFRAVNDESE